MVCAHVYVYVNVYVCACECACMCVEELEKITNQSQSEASSNLLEAFCRKWCLANATVFLHMEHRLLQWTDSQSTHPIFLSLVKSDTLKILSLVNKPKGLMWIKGFATNKLILRIESIKGNIYLTSSGSLTITFLCLKYTHYIF